MSFEIKKIYTENPYVDEMVYYTKLMGIDTTLKMKNLADSKETLESLKHAELYIACMEGTVIFEILPSLTRTCLAAAGIVTPELVKKCLVNKDNVPADKRAAVTAAFSAEFIENYEDLNDYYRGLHGLPPIGREDYIEDWLPPDGIAIDISKPIHLMDNAEAVLLDRYGVLDQMIEEDPINRQYMRHLGKKKIDYYTARKANRFDPLYIPSIDSDAIYKMYKDKLDANKFYVLRTVYSEAFAYGSDYYDNFIAILIVIITILDIISRVQEFIARKEIFDIRSVQYIFKSNGIPFYEEIPLRYQISMVKNLHTLLKYKSTKRCMVDICSLFGFNNIKIFKYYLLKDRKIDLTTGEYVYAKDENGEDDLEAMYELKFLKLPLEDDVDDYIRVAANYMDYDEIVDQDSTWDGGLDHNQIIRDILKEEFNFTRTKYISIDTIYDIANISSQQSYFFNFLYDNQELEELLTIQVPFIEAGRDFKIADLFTFLTVLGYNYNGIKDTIMDTQSKVLYVNGFNFKTDLATLAALVPGKKRADTIPTVGTIDHAREQLENFQVPTSSIPSMNEMMEMYINNLEIRDELIKGMSEADNKHTYMIYKKLYDALMITELTFDYYKNPETNDYYRDTEGDATFTEFLKHKDTTLYALLVEVQMFEDDASRNQYIANIIDSITWALEEYISTEDFQGIYANIPVVSAEVVKQYIAQVINFYKSYKVDFLGLNTIYTLDDKLDGMIQMIDCMHFNRFFQKHEYLNIHEGIAKSSVDMSIDEKLKLIERIYFDIYTWAYVNGRTNITLTDFIYDIYYFFYKDDNINLDEEFGQFNTTKSIRENLQSYFDYATTNSTLIPADKLDIGDRIWLYTYKDKEPTNVLIADADGNPVKTDKIITDVNLLERSSGMVTEKAFYDYLDANVIMTKDIADSTNINTNLDEASNLKVVSEKAMYEVLDINVIEPPIEEPEPEEPNIETNTDITDSENVLEDDDSNI